MRSSRDLVSDALAGSLGNHSSTMPAVASGTVAVTGANGFIGSYMCAALLEKGYTVRAVVRNSSDEAKVAHLLALPGGRRARHASGQLLEAGGYDDAFAGCAAVVHTAAVVEILDNSDAENKIVRPAVEGTKNVLASCRKAGIQRAGDDVVGRGGAGAARQARRPPVHRGRLE